MAAYRLSRLAEADLLEIAAYTQCVWGDDQALSYLNSLDACCQRVAGNPQIGRECGYIRPGLRRIEHERHVLFYRQKRGCILISRILHQQMLPALHSLGGEEE